MATDLKLVIELIPETSWYNNLRSLLPPDAWHTLRKKVLETSGNKCSICHASGYLHCHEVWRYDDEQYIQQLVAITPLCEMCHAVKHIGHTKTKTKEFYEETVAHFMKINGCNRMTFEQHKNEAFTLWEERSKHEWRIDIGQYEGVNLMI